MNSVANNTAGRHPRPLHALACITGENATLHRAILRTFVEARERFVFKLRQPEIVDGMRTAHSGEIPEEKDIEAALSQLCDWGSLQALPDISDVRIVEEFYKPRHVYRITADGEAAERACAGFRSASTRIELQNGGLADIREALLELRHLTVKPPLDSGKIRRKLRTLDALLEDFSITAQTFIEKLEQPATLRMEESGQLIEFGQKWVGEFELESDRIVAIVREIETAGTIESPYWINCRNWFLPQPPHPSTFEKLRERTRTAMPVLIREFAIENERGLHRIDRAHDFLVLARWFVTAESDADAHILWRTAFGLRPARHLSINEATLDDREARQIPFNTSWLDAPPLRIPAGIRGRRGNWRTEGLSRIIDRSIEREKLAAAAHEESRRLLETQRRFGAGNRIRLSELEQLETNEFELFLDLLGDAASRAFSAESLEMLSGDGSLRVRMEPIMDGRTTTLRTTGGMLSGPDFWIQIEDTAAHETREVPA